MTAKLTGSIPALVTPMDVSGACDEAAFERFVDWQISEGSHALVPVGTTGESSTLSHAEHERIVEIAVKVAAGRVPVIAGAGSNSTSESIALAQHAQAVGADAILVVAPYYNKPSQEGIYQHYAAIHSTSDIPIIVYDIPGRSIVRIRPETMARLAELPRIIGTKDASGDLVAPWAHRMLITKDFRLLSGNDETALAYLALGGQGCISVAANVAPRLCAAFQNAWAAGQLAEAQAINDRLMPLHEALLLSNPATTKWALAQMGRMTARVRLPLVEPDEETRAAVRTALERLELL